MAMFRGRELTEEEGFEETKRQQDSGGMQRQSTLDAIKRIMAAGPQAEPAPAPAPAPMPAPAPVAIPPMLERPQGVIPEALIRPVAPAAPQLPPEMLRRAPEVQPPRTAQGMVVEKFGGDMNAYNKWWGSLPQSMKPRSWEQALGMVSSPEALGVPKAAPAPVAPVPSAVPPVAAQGGETSVAAPVAATAPRTSATAGVKRYDGADDDGESMLHPVAGRQYLASSSGVRTYKGVTRAHQGDDYAGTRGDPLVAMGDGKVIYSKDWTTKENKAARGNSGGHRLEVEYGKGDNRFRVRYFHLDKAPALKKGNAVKRGDPVGLMGSSGGTSSGAHLHAELRRFNPKTKKYELHDFDKFLKGGGKGKLSDTVYDTRRKSVRGKRPDDMHEHSAEEEVLKKFGGKMSGSGSYDEWYNSIPASKRPEGWAAALTMLKKA